MQFEAVQPIQSKIEPTVTYTIRQLNKVDRARRDRTIQEQKLQYSAACMAYMEEMQSAGYELTDRIWKRKEDAPPKPADFDRRMAALDAEVTNLFNEFIVPASLRAGLMSITGLAKGDTPINTADALLACGPEADDFIDEVYLLCEGGAGLSEEEKKSSPSVTTSSEPAADPINTSTATPAAA